MKLTLKIILNILRGELAIVILMFSIATLIGRSYLQTALLWLLVLTIIYWPSFFRTRLNLWISTSMRLGLILILFVVSFLVIKPEPKTSIYTSEAMKSELMGIYDQHIGRWPEGTEDIFVDTRYGSVHVLACGETDNPPLVMIHAASMGAHSWAENLDPLLEHYRIFSIDNIGEGNKSTLQNPLVFPAGQKEIAEHLASILDALGVQSSPAFGASNGGFVALSFAYYYPERVQSLALFGPMGLTQLNGQSIFMLSVASMYPFQFVRDRVAEWALGDDPFVQQQYGDWFNCIMKGTIPSVGKPVPMTTEQKTRMDMPILLFLGTKDKIVGDVAIARQEAEEYPNIRIEVLDSGHLVAVEHAEYVNSVVVEFLRISKPTVQESDLKE